MIKYVGAGYQDYFQPYIEIYNKYNECIYSGYTYNGKITVCLKIGTYYKIKAFLNGQIINNVFYTNYYQKSYSFVLTHTLKRQNQNNITFLLTDKNYFNLPISKGELILWQKQ